MGDSGSPYIRCSVGSRRQLGLSTVDHLKNSFDILYHAIKEMLINCGYSMEIGR